MLARSAIHCALLLSLLAVPGCRPDGSVSTPNPVTPVATNRDDDLPLLPDPTPVQLASFNKPPLDDDKADDEDLNLDPVQAMTDFEDVSELDDDLSPEREKELLAKLAKRPKDPEVLFSLADFKQLKAEAAESGEPDFALFKESADYLRRALAADAKLVESDAFKTLAPFAFVNEARALGRERKIAPALKALRQAVEYGWNDLSLLQEDTELASIRANPEFAKIIQFGRDRRKKEVQTIVSALFINRPDFKFDFDLTDTRGKPIAKKDFTSKVLVVNVWGTWCGPCRQELKDFITISKKFKSQGVEFVGLNTEYETGETAQTSIRDLQKSFGIPYRCALGDDTLFEQIPNFGTVPTTLFFNRAGLLVAQWEGVADEILLESIIERILKDSPSSTKTE